MSYGSDVHAPELMDLLRLQLQSKDLPPLCIWGAHGIGKTEIVRDLAEELGIQFQYLAPAQFEELGDLLGMPAIVDGQTVLRPPAWAPTDSRPGILLLDDLNRADDRILRGLMPLLQGFGMVSWKLPPSWRIVCTANPDDGSYSVSTLDPAIRTRLMHVHLHFDPRAWAAWAQRKGIPQRDIQFVAENPNFLTESEQTTARTVSQFFLALQQLPDSFYSLDKIKLLANAFLDEKTSNAYLEYYEQWDFQWMDPKEYLLSNPTETTDRLHQLLQQGPRWQSAFGLGLIRALSSTEVRITDRVQQNLLQFLHAPSLTKPFRIQFGRDLAGIEKESIRTFLSDPEVVKLFV